MSRVMEDSSRTRPRKLEKPVCRRWRGWTAAQQVGWRKPTGVSDTSEVWRQIRWCTAVQSSEGHYGDFKQDALLNAKPVERQMSASVMYTRSAISWKWAVLPHSLPTEDAESSWQTTQPTHCCSSQVGRELAQLPLTGKQQSVSTCHRILHSWCSVLKQCETVRLTCAWNKSESMKTPRSRAA